VFYQLQTSYHLYFFIHMSSGDGPMDVSQEHGPQLQMELATHRAHIQLLTERLTGSEARGEHASDLRLHAADLRAQVEATKAAADSALHELRLQHTREAELLQRVVEGMQAQLRDKERVIRSKDEMVAQLVRQLADKDQVIQSKDEMVALLTRQLADKDSMVALLTRQLADKDKQLPVLFQTAVGDIQAESRALRADRDAAVATASEKQAQVMALTATVAERDRTIATHLATAAGGPVAGSVVAADNFHVGARVTSYNPFAGTRHGVIHGVTHSMGGTVVSGRWDQGDVLQVRVPDPSFAYSQIAK
jgi:chromosome segregation ATPase